MKPSLRECKEDDIEADHIMKTTPEFRNFVSKKLSAYLEEEIEDIKVDDAGKCVNGVVDPGVRLLAKSRSKLNKTTLRGDDDVVQQKRPKLLKKSEKSMAYYIHGPICHIEVGENKRPTSLLRKELSWEGKNSREPWRELQGCSQ